MSLCAVGGDPVRDLKLGDGADAVAGAAVGQDGAAARQLRSLASPSARSFDRRWSDRLRPFRKP
jgi:hypothetical protein